MGDFWHDFLYTPLLNFLIFLYNGPAFGNMGVAIVELTVILRFALLPLSILDERNRYRYEKLDRRVEEIERDFKDDHIRRKEKIRELLKEHKVNYWSKVFLLGIQFIVLVLLYQVFVSGVKFTKYEILYSWVGAPDAVNTMFLGFDLSQRSWFWAGIVAVLLFVNTYTVQKQREHLVTKSDVTYLVLFPLFTLVILGVLPMVKSVFVLTSMIFTMVIFGLRKTFFRLPPEMG